MTTHVHPYDVVDCDHDWWKAKCGFVWKIKILFGLQNWTYHQGLFSHMLVAFELQDEALASRAKMEVESMSQINTKISLTLSSGLGCFSISFPLAMDRIEHNLEGIGYITGGKMITHGKSGSEKQGEHFFLLQCSS